MRKRIVDLLPEDDGQDINLTPMLDVVFIMLIFFIVTATFVKESGIEVDKPIAQTAVLQERASILIAIDRDGAVWLDRRSIDVRSVRAAVERLHAENPQTGVVIQADANARAKTLLRVLDAVRAAGVSDIALGAQTER